MFGNYVSGALIAVMWVISPLSVASASLQEVANEFAANVAQHQYVALGEQSHGAANVYNFKREAVKALHKNHNFNVLALESGLYDVDWLYREFVKNGASIEQSAPGNIFYMYANSAELKPLFKYIEQSHSTDRPLKLVGFDSQLTGGISKQFLVKELGSLLPPFNAQFSKTQWQEVAAVLQSVIEINSTKPKNTDVFFELFAQLEAHALGMTTRPAFWQRILVGLKAQAKRQWQLSDMRSHEMGNNLVWQAKLHKGQKMIIWAHIYHLQKERVDGAQNAGQVMFAQYPSAYHVTHFTGGKGQFVDFVSMKTRSVSALAKNSVELAANKLDCDICVLDVRTLLRKAPSSEVLLVDYETSVPLKDIAHKWDSLVHFAHVTPSKQQ
ncbi:hypothetical protein BGP78_21985 [Pseudoalteromonas sp. MSK9-3]|uniref:erythromycin esterase family protein n=1 Tax=Pseudoalteromonas sp. MSK9-3 TaxID=1897633 RepID=UPI000EDE8EBF|nr:erythromycin esterase family protein [Pseudoalteromonas sp. MSK9-3]RJE71148.1 hypothetical protein BGP78_21985 [Pseudoalteromonas sp. MSK9-3]